MATTAILAAARRGDEHAIRVILDLWFIADRWAPVETMDAVRTLTDLLDSGIRL